MPASLEGCCAEAALPIGPWADKDAEPARGTASWFWEIPVGTVG